LLMAFAVLLLELRQTDRELDDQRAQNAELVRNWELLSQFAITRSEVDRRTALLQDALATEVSWSVIMQRISEAIPEQAWLTDLAGVLTVDGEPEPAPGGLIGAIEFSGVSLSTPSVAAWLNRLEAVPEFANPWLSTTEKSPLGGVSVVNFRSSVDITTDAVLHRGGGQL
jgi:Tfp pilus assembly protein PilN